MIKHTERIASEEKKKRLAAGTLLAILLLCAVSAAYVSGTRTAEVLARKRELPVYSVDRDDGKIAISFDAA